jgi:pantoate--beta-alanine ligase
MDVIKTIKTLKEARADWAHPVGLVPTMGYLHDGHLELVRRARADSRTVVVTIFVNPTQFGPSEDLARYPRSLERDLELLEKEGTDTVIVPEPAEMYPDHFSTWVDVEDVSAVLEGAHRPGHFRGVATVCNKLFNIAAPERAYFGQKDAQQVAVIKRMVRDLNMNLDIVVVPTVRESDGLAMSSRNVYLSPEERRAAVALYRALSAAREAYRKGVTHGEALRLGMREVVNAEPLAELDYATVVAADTFIEVEVAGAGSLAVIAARLGRARLIDNMYLDEAEAPR